jgi:hypothetical protein
MKYIVKCVSLLDNSTMQWEFNDLGRAKEQIRHLQDLGANTQLINLYETITV